MRRCLVFAVAAMLLLSASGRANELSFLEATEVMLHAQAADVHVLPRLFGVDLTPLFYSNSIDATSHAFSYATVPGTSYLGMPLSLSSSGTRDDVTNTWQWSSMASLGAESWTAAGSIEHQRTDGGWEFNLKWEGVVLRLPLDLELKFSASDFQIFPPQATSQGSGMLTVGGEAVATVTVSDIVTPSTERPFVKLQITKFDFKLSSADPGLAPFALATTGETNEGGEGTFTTQVVPETTPFVLLISGCLLMFCRRETMTWLSSICHCNRVRQSFARLFVRGRHRALLTLDGG